MKRLFKHMSIYGLGGILTRSINFILLPFYTHVLVPSDYGKLELIYMLGSILAILFSFMVTSGFIRNYFDFKASHYRQELFSTAFWFLVTVSILSSSILILFSQQIGNTIFTFPNGGYFLKLIIIATTIHTVSRLFYGFLQVKEKSLIYILFQIITLTINVSLTILFVAKLKWGVAGVFKAQIIGFSLEFLGLSIFLLRKNIFSFSFKYTIEMLKFSIPLIPINLSAFILNLSDRFFLQEYQNLDEVGLYSVGYKITALIPLVAVTPLKALGPYLYSMIGDVVKLKKHLSDFTRYYFAGILTVVFTLGLFSKEIILVISGENYLDSWKVVYLLGISYFFYGVSNVIVFAIHIRKKSWIVGSSWIIAAVLNIGLNFLLIPKYGMIGASIATVLSYFAVLLGYFLIIRIIYPIKFKYIYFLFIFVLSSMINFGLLFLNIDQVILIFLKIFIFLVFVSIILISGYFSKEEIRKGKILLKNIFLRRLLKNGN